MTEPTTLRESVERYDNGNLRFRGRLMEGAMHGHWEFFRRDGTLMRAGDFDRGRQIGTWRTYNREGHVVKETRFDEPTHALAADPASSEGDGHAQPPS